MRTRGPLCACVGAIALFATSLAGAAEAEFRGVVASVEQTSPENLQEWKRAGFGTIALALAGEAPATRAAAERIRASGLELAYWIEVARNEALANAHPEWMASLQGHPEWRRLFPKLPEAKAGEVVKNWPWVPVLYRESFEAQLARVSRLLADIPAPDRIFLNDLQAAPSACGCGNVMCRWVSDYGPIETATRLSDDAAAKFVAAVGALSPKAGVVPVWTPECEQDEKNGHCGGLGCFHGKCWGALATQLKPVLKQSEMIAALVVAKELGHDDAKAAWMNRALRSLAEQPQHHGGEPVAVKRLVAVIQGWDSPLTTVDEQIEACRTLGVSGHLLALTRIDQSWEPRIVPIPPKATGPDKKH